MWKRESSKLTKVGRSEGGEGLQRGQGSEEEGEL